MDIAGENSDSKRDENSDPEISKQEKEKFLLSEDASPYTDPHETWTNKVEYVLALVGFTVGIGSIWRFPMVCARNGGGAFIIPFVLLTMLIGAPLYYLEICLGQFTGYGPCKSFEFCPLLKGIGHLMVTMAVFILWYYQTVMAWIVYFFYRSFSSVLPWSTCSNWWNTNACRGAVERLKTIVVLLFIVFPVSWDQILQKEIYKEDSSAGERLRTIMVVLFVVFPVSWDKILQKLDLQGRFKREVLRSSSTLEEFGNIQPHLSVSLLIAWIIVLACLFRGVKSLGKVVYFTALFPYVLLTILLIRGVTLDGSLDGLLFFCKPDFSKLGEIEVWLDASLQVFYSLGPIWGCIITMSAHNKFHQTVIKETVIVCFADAFTALYAGLVVFSVLGFMAKEAGVPIQDLATASGHGLAFVVYPTAVSLMPLPQLWAVMFFFMMLLVILDSVFANFETIAGTAIEYLPTRFQGYKAIIHIVMGVCFFLSGQMFLVEGGIHLFRLVDWYCTAFALLIGAFIESHMVGNIYGADRYAQDIEIMTGRKLSRFTRFLICIVIPIFALGTFLLCLINHRTVKYDDKSNYQPYAVVLGFLIGLMPIIVMCCINMKEIWITKGSLKQRLIDSISPSHKWKPKDKATAADYLANPYIYEKTFLDRMKTNLWGQFDTPYL